MEQIKMLLQSSRKFFSTYWHMNYNTDYSDGFLQHLSAVYKLLENI